MVKVRNKIGKPYYYLHKYRGTSRAEHRQRLAGEPGSAEFWESYALLMRIAKPVRNTKTFEHLIEEWHASPHWKGLSSKTSVDWKRQSGRIQMAWGGLEVPALLPQHIAILRDSYGDKPAAANNLLRCLSSMISWSIERGYRSDNPCAHVRHFPSGHGYAPWPWDVIEDAERELSVHRIDLWWAVALALYTGQRQADVLAMEWSNISTTGMLSLRQGKTGKSLVIKLHRDLIVVLDKIPKRDRTILTNTDGLPWTGTSGFTNAFNDHKPSKAAQLGLVFHGLRKSAVVTLLEAGCTDAEVAAITGQSRNMVEHYAKMVNQERLARSAILRWENIQND